MYKNNAPMGKNMRDITRRMLRAHDDALHTIVSEFWPPFSQKKHKKARIFVSTSAGPNPYYEMMKRGETTKGLK